MEHNTVYPPFAFADFRLRQLLHHEKFFLPDMNMLLDQLMLCPICNDAGMFNRDRFIILLIKDVHQLVDRQDPIQIRQSHKIVFKKLPHFTLESSDCCNLISQLLISFFIIRNHMVIIFCFMNQFPLVTLLNIRNPVNDGLRALAQLIHDIFQTFPFICHQPDNPVFCFLCQWFRH